MLAQYSRLPTTLFVTVAITCIGLSTLDRTYSGIALFALFAAIFSDFIRSKAQGTSPPKKTNLIESKIQHAALLCLIIFSCSLIIKSIPTIYWGESIFNNNFEIRLTLAALAAYTMSLIGNQLRIKNEVLFISIFFALLIALYHAYNYIYYGIMTPYHVISWIGGISFLYLIILLGISDENRTIQMLSYAGLLAGSVTIIISAVRAAYPVVFIVFLLAPIIAARSISLRGLLIKYIVFCLALLTIIFSTGGLDIFKSRVSQGLNQFSLTINNIDEPEIYASTSVGARIYMWNKSVEAALENPTLGLGRNALRERLKEWGGEVKSNEVYRQRHVHNDYVQSFVNHGALGLMSWLFVLAGLFYITLIFFQISRSIGLVSSAILISHSFMSFFNSNSMHNNYPTFLALALLILFKIAMNFSITSSHKISSPSSQ